VLTIRRGGEPALISPVWASARLRHITTRGLRVAAPAADASADPGAAAQPGHHLLIDGDAAGALAAYDRARLPRDASWVIARTQALDALGRRAEALAELRGAVARGVDIENRLWHLVRVHDRVFAPLAQAVLGPSYVTRFVIVWDEIIGAHPDDAHMQELVTSTSLDASGVAAGTREQRQAAVILLAYRGDAWWRLGHFGAARADLERALALGVPLVGAPGAPSPGRTRPIVEYLADAHALLAAILAASGDEAGALAHARAALAVTPHPESTRDNIARYPDLAALRGRAGWNEVLPP